MLRSTLPFFFVTNECSNFFKDEDTNYFEPDLDVKEDDKFYALSLDLPGFKKEDINLQIKDGHLIISGERKQDEGSFLRRERKYGKFTRSLKLNDEIDGVNTKASFKDGVLNITLPKTESKSALIPIE